MEVNNRFQHLSFCHPNFKKLPQLFITKQPTHNSNFTQIEALESCLESLKVGIPLGTDVPMAFLLALDLLLGLCR